MAIEIKVDSAKELYWMRRVLNNGVLNSQDLNKWFKHYGVDTKQVINYVKSDNYVEDLNDVIERDEKERATETEPILENDIYRCPNKMCNGTVDVLDVIEHDNECHWCSQKLKIDQKIIDIYTQIRDDLRKKYDSCFDNATDEDNINLCDSES